MITEFRRLVFSNDELKTAIEFFHKEKTPLFVSGEVESVSPEDGDKPGACVRLALPGSTERKELHLDTTQLGAIMLLHLIRIKTPIPRSGHKQIERVGDCLALRLTINAAPGDFSLD